jgi:hypothetical protein
MDRFKVVHLHAEHCKKATSLVVSILKPCKKTQTSNRLHSIIYRYGLKCDQSDRVRFLCPNSMPLVDTRDHDWGGAIWPSFGPEQRRNKPELHS